jgi:hypothetical protein
MGHWKTFRTLLLVGEGATEEAFLRHVKSLYAPRGSGLKVTIKDAHGKGAKHVVDWTSRQIGEYDSVGALLDTDQDWSDAVARKAKSAKIVVLKSEPQIEAMLLRLIGQNANGDSNTLKARLAPFVGNDALRPENYAGRFDKQCLESGRRHEQAVDDLLVLLGSPSLPDKK